MIDFAKLADPAYQAQLRAEREAEEAKLAEKTARLKTACNTCLGHIEELAERERSLVRTCHHKLSTFGVLSKPQETWLLDIARRFSPAA